MKSIVRIRKLADHPFYPSFRMGGEVNGRNNSAPMNIIQNDDVYKVELALPGWTKDEVRIEIEDNTLKISGEKSQEKEKEVKEDQTVHRQEFYTNRFYRSVILNETVNQEEISAKMENGILIIDLKKYSKEEKPGFRKVEIL